MAILFGRMLPVVRTYISFPAGLARVPLGRFAALTVVGALPWNLALAFVGYTLGEQYHRIAQFIQDGGYLLAILLAVILLGWWIRGRRRPSERELSRS
jgi:membrane protein DedA with SNARE-associated domain